MRKTIRWLVPLLLSPLIFTIPAQAQDTDYTLQITPFAGYRFGGTFEDKDDGQEYDLADDASYGLIVNFPSIDNTEWEIYYSRQKTDLDIAGFETSGAALPVTLEYLQLGGTYLFPPAGKAQPYFAATIGAARADPDAPNTKSDTWFSFGIGGGWKYFPTNHFGLRLDGRLLGSFIDSNSRLFCQSGSSGGSCVISTAGKLLYQVELQAGVIVRF
jgi:hypothetical protein